MHSHGFQTFVQVAVCALLFQHLGLSPPAAWALRTASEWPSRNKTPIYIAGFFPFSDYFNDMLVNSTEIAIDHVNEFQDLLADYELRMIWNWTQVEGENSAAPSLKVIYDFIYNQPQFLMTWGPVYSRVGEVLNEVIRRYNLVQVCIAQFVSNERHLEKYPLTVQIYPSSGVFNPARIVLMKQMGWKRAAIIFENYDLFRAEMEELDKLLQDHGLTTTTLEAITGSDPSANVQNLKKHDARIIFGSFYQEMATRVFCEAYRKGYYGPKYVWILLGWYSPVRWWVQEIDKFVKNGEDICTAEEVEKVVVGSLSIRGFEIQTDMSKINFNGVRPLEKHLDFYADLQDQLLTAGACDSYGYDQIITIALALNASIQALAEMDPPRRLEDFTYEDTAMSSVFLEKTRSVDFVGLTGRVAFDEYGARESDAVVQQMQDVGSNKQVFKYDGLTEKVTQISEFIWAGGFKPVDGPTYSKTQLRIQESIKIVVFVLSGLGMALSIVFLGINTRFKNRSAIKISSPQLNNMIALGSMLLYASTFLLALKIEVKEGDFNGRIYCQLSSAALCIGLSLAFGALFMKTYRIHHIYTSAMKVRKVRATITDSKLMTSIGLFVLLDALIFVTWILVDPIHVETIQLSPVLRDERTEKYDVPTMSYCTSAKELYFAIAIFAYKGALLIFGIFLAWSTRNVRISQLNDSKHIALSVYTVGLTCVLTVPVAYFSQARGDINFVFAFVCGALFVANTIVLCLVFIPKFISLKTTEGARINTFMPSSNFTISQDKQATISRLRQLLEEKNTRLETLLHQLEKLVNTELVP
ncbi:gamma-aminobutyric acid type B receptor subunit 2-like [Acanthaster planci]|uniref:Gamma-aminobutyric acid type B receptor subunit 2 n=1 Tax=Acanthaster planci TaxID=133434 RepID=A0A8B7XWD4_ACAPL|nr:gamma-aminobutyric acid type B receptor subunit 2-like [Acanthaster planci]XP_022085183.1 gamma-aminobutyric acid type B receptor subunit 2-like [Acanthaster planci]XP_022085184.1 gamma-aminobutyric acid type B receptor subunit 2-like [Acanthaster planci]